MLSQQTSLCPRPLGLAMDVSWGSRFNPQPCQATSNCRLLHHPLLQSYLSSRLNINPVFSPLPSPSLYCLPELLIMVDFGSDFTTVVRFGSYANKPVGLVLFHGCSGYNPQPPSHTAKSPLKFRLLHHLPPFLILVFKIQHIVYSKPLLSMPTCLACVPRDNHASQHYHIS